MLLRRVLSGRWHKFASGFVQAPIAAFPFVHQALPLTAVKFAQGNVLRDFLNNLVSKPPPDPMGRQAAFQLLFGHVIEPSVQIKELPRLN
jgi:hypothetical protein